jgi:adenosine/AMP kinase
MFCEGDKTYPENVGCPVCGMDLVKITGNDDESEDDTYKNLKKILDFCGFYASHFYFIDGRNVF